MVRFAQKDTHGDDILKQCKLQHSSERLGNVDRLQLNGHGLRSVFNVMCRQAKSCTTASIGVASYGAPEHVPPPLDFQL